MKYSIQTRFKSVKLPGNILVIDPSFTNMQGLVRLELALQSFVINQVLF